MTACEWCDGTNTVVLGTGNQADFFDCPVCVGLFRGHLTGYYAEEVSREAFEYGCQIRWLDTEKSESYFQKSR